MTFDLILGLAMGLILGGAVGGVEAWRLLLRSRTIKPPTGKLGSRLPRGTVPDDRYPLW